MIEYKMIYSEDKQVRPKIPYLGYQIPYLISLHHGSEKIFELLKKCSF